MRSSAPNSDVSYGRTSWRTLDTDGLVLRIAHPHDKVGLGNEMGQRGIIFKAEGAIRMGGDTLYATCCR